MTSIGTLYLHFAPVTCIRSEPSSSYSIFASPLSPNDTNVSSGIATTPVPFGFRIILPSVLVDANVLPSILKLSTFHKSTFLSPSRIGTNPFASVDGFCCPATLPGSILNKSVKYLPPISCGLLELSPANTLPPLLPCVPTPTVKPNSPKFRVPGADVPVDLLTLIILAIRSYPH